MLGGDVDPVVVVVVVAASVVLAEQLAALAADRLGDNTARRAGTLWSVHRRAELLGTLLAPAVLALVGPSGLTSFGWGKPAARRPGALVGWRYGAAAAVAPAVHGLLALVAMAVDGSVAGVGEVGLLVARSNAVMATFLLLPLPWLPGGALVGLALRGDRRTRWDGWARVSRAPAGLVVAALVGWSISGPAAPLLAG